MTNTFRALVESRLNSIKTTYNIADISYRVADDDKMYPHLVWDILSISPTDHGRRDYTMDVHVWTKDQLTAFNIADTVSDLFSYANLPQTLILPTFYETNVHEVEDPDKDICHLVVRIEGQLYDSNEGGFTWQQ